MISLFDSALSINLSYRQNPYVFYSNVLSSYKHLMATVIKLSPDFLPNFPQMYKGIGTSVHRGELYFIFHKKRR